jgi:hypothetical protein
MYRAIALAVALAAGLTSIAVAQSLKGSGQFYYQPPVVPIQFALDANGELSVQSANQVVTPLGTFGLGAGMAAAPASVDSTCFLVRRRKMESVYCIGKSGRIRLTTRGASIVEISAAPRQANLFIIDVLRERGRFRVDFVPDVNAKETARIRIGPFTQLALRPNGEVVLDQVFDTVIKPSRLDGLNLYLTPRGSALCLFYNDGASQRGQIRSPFDQRRTLEARWFMHVARASSFTSASTQTLITPIRSVIGTAGVYPDGTVNQGLALVCGRDVARVAVAKEYVNAARIYIRPESAPFYNSVSDLIVAFRDEAGLHQFLADYAQASHRRRRSRS